MNIILLQQDTTLTISNLLNGHLWEIIGILVAIIIGLFSIFIIWKKKKLSYVLSITELISSKDEIKEKVDFVYNQSTIRNVHLCILKIINSGNVAIRKEDFERNLKIVFNKDCEVMDLKLISSNPININPKITNNNNQIIINPVLLNKKDSFSLKILLADYNNVYNIDARILGIKRINRIETDKIYLDKFDIVKYILNLVLFNTVFFFILYINDFIIFTKSIIQIIIPFVLIICGMVSNRIYMYYKTKKLIQ